MSQQRDIWGKAEGRRKKEEGRKWGKSPQGVIPSPKDGRWEVGDGRWQAKAESRKQKAEIGLKDSGTQGRRDEAKQK